MRYDLMSLAGLLSAASLLSACRDPIEPDIDRVSGPTQAMAGLAAPSALSATPVSSSQIGLAWKDNSSNESGFDIRRSQTGPVGTFTVLVRLGPNVTRHSDLGLTSEKQYCYRIRSFRTSGGKTTYTAFSNTACATTPVTRPGAPTNVYVRPAWSDGVIIGWSDNADNEAGYRVERSAQSTDPWVTVVIRGAMNGLHSQEATDAGLTPDLPVCYRVVAFSSTGDSPSAARCTVPPARPTNLTAKPVDDRSIELTWTDNSAFEDGYKVLRMGSGLPGEVVATLPANASSYRETGLSGNMTYEYRVQATKDGGNSSPSEVARASLALLPPAAPTNATAFPAGSTAIAVYWRDHTLNDDGFHIERSTDRGLTWEFAVDGRTSDGILYGVTDVNRTPEREVCYRVIAWNAAGESGSSNTSCTTPPAAPTDVVWTGIDGNTAELHWTDNSQVEEGYVVVAFGTQGDWLLLASVPPNSTSAQYDLAQVPSSYSGPSVAAIKDGGYSDWGF